MIASAVLALGALFPASSGVSPASDNSGSHICLIKHPRYCLNLFHDKFAGGNFVVMHDRKGQGLGWKVVKVGTVCAGGTCGRPRPFHDHHLDQRYKGRPVYKIKKTKGSSGQTSGCLGAQNFEGTGNLAALALPCQAFNGAIWVYSRNKNLVQIDPHNGTTLGNLATDKAGNNNDVCFCTDQNSRWSI